MIDLTVATACRLSGEPLERACTILDIPTSPIPGLYPHQLEDSLRLRSPLRVVQAVGSRFVQLAHIAPAENYAQYSFSGGTSQSYRKHLFALAEEICRRFPRSTPILEVGCGDGWLLRRLWDLGFHDVCGIDPGRAAADSHEAFISRGYFPADLPRAQAERKFGLVLCRHVLEHIEQPVPFVGALSGVLREDAELWIEVPDLDSTINGGLWNNFYQLHCNYFTLGSLCAMVQRAGLVLDSAHIVDVFGGSLLCRFRFGKPSRLTEFPLLDNLDNKIIQFRSKLSQLAHQCPLGTVGYGAAERTSVTFGFCPQLEECLECLFDGNRLIDGRYLGGTSLQIHRKEELYNSIPPGVVLFAISNAREIIAEWKKRLPPNTPIAIAGVSRTFAPLATMT